MIRAVVLDMDGVLVESEQIWDAVREGLARERGGRWSPRAHRDMMGMSTPEWTAYMRDEVGVDMPAEEIAAEVSRRVADAVERERPVLPGAPEAVARLAARWPLGLASSSSRPVIERVLAVTRTSASFRVTVSSEEVARGKPSPDVYLRATALLGVDPAEAVAVEDSARGIRAARAAGLAVVAVPNRGYPPDREALALACAEVAVPGDLTVSLVEGCRPPADG